jgi:2-C-methyl-D-erythritol 4-phosphate cytidylyltransferase
MSRLNLNVVIAAAGIGKRVGANIPKQYLPLLGKTIIEHSIAPFLNHSDIKKVIVSIAENDIWFAQRLLKILGYKWLLAGKSELILCYVH